jgi:chromosome segregation ATPase
MKDFKLAFEQMNRAREGNTRLNEKNVKLNEKNVKLKEPARADVRHLADQRNDAQQRAKDAEQRANYAYEHLDRDHKIHQEELNKANAERDLLRTQLNDLQKAMATQQQKIDQLTRERDNLSSNLTKQLLRVRIANEQRFDRLQQLHDDEVQAIIDAYEAS